MPLGDLLYATYRDHVRKRPDYIIAVPSHRRRVRERGFDSIELLARRLAHKTGVPISRSARRILHTKPQYGLDEKSRRRNLQAAFAIQARPELRGSTVLVVDDILTTGTTATELSNSLKQEAGVKEVGILVVARTIRTLAKP